ncbi:MAG: hypothetical protein ABWZ52_14305 [Acidimicrobiales bacterium]
MKRGDRDPRPPIEIWDDEPAAESVQVVTTGPRTRRSRVRALAACAGIVVVLMGGLVLGDDDRPAATERGAPDDDEANAGTDRATTGRRDTTTRPEPTTTTTEVLPGAPLLGEPSGLQVVVGGSRVIDLDTGESRRLAVRVLAETQRRLIVTGDGTAALWPAPYDGSGSTRIATIPAGRVVSEASVVGDGTLVWLVQRRPETGGPGQPVTADLVDLEGRTLAHLDIRDDLFPSGAVDRGVVASGPGGTYVIDPEGAAQRISTGTLITAAHNRVHAYTCDEHLQCGLETLDERGQRLDWSPIEDPNPGSPIAGFAVAAAPDGRRAFIVYRDGQPNQVFLDGVLVSEAAAGGNPAWSPDGRWLAVPVAEGIHFIDTHRGNSPVALEIGQIRDQYLHIFIFSSR